MSTTDELRAELTKCGVEWEDMSARFPTGMLQCTSWTSQDGDPLTALEGADDIPDGKLSVQALLTPTQAIAVTVGSGRAEDVIRQLIARLGDAADFYFARKYVDCIVEEYVTKLATLGAGACHNVHEPPNDETFWPAPHFKCSECGATHVSMEYVFYCPNCGRKVVDE